MEAVETAKATVAGAATEAFREVERLETRPSTLDGQVGAVVATDQVREEASEALVDTARVGSEAVERRSEAPLDQSAPRASACRLNRFLGAAPWQPMRRSDRRRLVVLRTNTSLQRRWRCSRRVLARAQTPFQSTTSAHFERAVYILH